MELKYFNSPLHFKASQTQTVYMRSVIDMKISKYTNITKPSFISDYHPNPTFKIQAAVVLFIPLQLRIPRLSSVFRYDKNHCDVTY